MMEAEKRQKEYDVVVVGGGAAGVGVGVALANAGIWDFVILERHVVGGSFALWPAETRFITPSFPTNTIGMLDLNAVALGTSPAFSLAVEHPTGLAYAAYLGAVARHYALPIQENTLVMRVTKFGDDFLVDTADATIRAKHVIWAAGEFQYPRLGGFEGAELCRHTATIPSYENLDGDDFVIVGGYESGVDAAYHLANRGKQVRLIDSGFPWENRNSDPSIALSTYSFERMNEDIFVEHVRLSPHSEVTSVTRVNGVFEVATLKGDTFKTPVQPLLATGFTGSHKLVAHMFESREDGFPFLSEDDESTIVPGLFLCGPAVRHDKHIFCFIYKFRQRFAVVAKAVATSLGLPAEGLEVYRQWGMYLDDLSLCGEECLC
ncbi:NAD(P)/FAD-dependent oxidoreductase [Acanthopleuribacter pedis]|uniref:NAD(P)-binding domain-containing protein n=1 Tax=Acanthopleuribacter pedis TaxID=442870 RepID=A0A8J7QFG5_9BACT|nr:NAD(P)/FAD-dependent oxidoreductase [Acanthopleuribacter pedis]MBO1323364.1 NAD(P)-binding domain-containing protein [Acanthopleuribacter pedis]